jgi:predicted nuclease of predicted toxin-antitoxin system
LVDAQLPPAPARWTDARGHEALHVSGFGFEDATDSAIWREAIRRKSVILSKDEGFVANRPGKPSSQSVWIR